MPPPPASNPFALLGLPPRFDLNAAEINAAHLRRAAALHPDLADAAQDDDESSRLAAELNDAKHQLIDPERRANALLALLGGPSKEQNRSLPDGFLMHIMETREEVEAAAQSKDPQRVVAWNQWAQSQREEYTARVSELFRALSNPPTPAQLAAIRTQLNAWRYIERLIEQLDAP